jgi:hypothetical protein
MIAQGYKPTPSTRKKIEMNIRCLDKCTFIDKMYVTNCNSSVLIIGPECTYGSIIASK